ncbi:MAG: SpoIIE family protein phosphatase [Spirochaetes bacterium]|nr:SpoIIE family protein phosphatase [Spirochaetota bacterium]
MLLSIPHPLQAQDLYWEDPEFIPAVGGRFPQVRAGGEMIVLMYQEFVPTREGEYQIFLSLRVSKNGRDWKEHSRFAGPYRFFGNETSIFSFAVTHTGIITVAVLASENKIDFFVSKDGGGTFQNASSKITERTTLAPRLFAKEDGGFILFVTQERGDILSILYAVSENGLGWTELAPLAPEPEVTLSFLPYHLSYKGMEYVVFQALQAGEGGAYQLYLKTSRDGGRTWGPLRWLTGFEEPIPGRTTRPGLFDNQRPHLASINGVIGIAWERRFGRESKQIYYGELNPDGTYKTLPERITTGFKSCNFPQIVPFKGTLFLLWFDNRKGDDHVILAQKQGALWIEKDLSPIAGVSTFPRPIVLGKELFVFWENKRGDTSRIVLLKPDTTVQPPGVVPLNFQAHVRTRLDTARFQLVPPRDSSGIAGFWYEWTRSPTPSPERRLMVLENVRTVEFKASEDGEWYVHVSAQDYAGNWSSPTTLRFYRDTTPPGKVVFRRPPRDELGFLVSNTFTIEWDPPKDEDVVEYRYEVIFVGETKDPLMPIPVSFGPLRRTFTTTVPNLQFRNYDNGVWAIRVSAVDSVGNVGPDETLVVHLNKYVPVTYISFVEASRDDTGRIRLSLLGRGFAEDGLVRRVILDRDGREPYDYQFTLAEGGFTVRNDRTIVGPVIQEVQGGEYRVAVEHPLRGIAFARDLLKLERGGTLKFGDYSLLYQPIQKILQRPPFSITLNGVVIWTIVMFLGIVALFSTYRIGAILQEGKRLRLEALALLTGVGTPWEVKRERLRAMKRRGFGLRLKFTFFITVLIIAVVLMVSIPLGYYMTRNQERNLAEGLVQRVSVLMESLASGARTYLPSGNTLELGVLPAQISAMKEARFATITGRGQTDLNYFGYVWASNDPEILNKIDSPILNPGVSKLKDEITEKEGLLAVEINTAAEAAVGTLAKELDVLANEAIGLAVRTDETSRRRLQDLQEGIRTLDNRLNARLLEIGAKIYSEPEFQTTLLDFDRNFYTFYKPVLYRVRGENRYFRGMVRLGVSTESILKQVKDSRNYLILITGGIALVALVLGIVGALILASIIIIPIRRLVKGVEVIRDTEDKEQLKDHVIEIKTRDEIAELAATINQMTQGLVKAAAASKDLTVGKEVQKMFIPLEVGPGGKKLTTGKEETPEGEFFGYYEGAKGVSGDYFDFRKLAPETYAFIKCDVAGKGVPAALIMVQVATVFSTYFRQWSASKGLNMVPLLYQINDVVESQGFRGRFAAMTLGVVEMQKGRAHVTHAGDRILNLYDAEQRQLVQRMMADCPATGVFPNFMLEMKSPFQQILVPMKAGDILLLFTDGVEEAHRKLRKPDFSILQLPPQKEGEEPVEDEMMGFERIKGIVEAVMSKGTFRLEKLYSPVPNEELIFDFSSCEPTAESTVLALVAVEKIFRMYPDPRAGAENRVMVDEKVDAFLKKTFLQYDRYFHHPIPNPRQLDFPNYNFYTHIMEDDQYDDLTLLAIRKK